MWADAPMYFTQVAAGQVPRHSVIHKFGANTSLTTSWQDVWENGGIYQFETSADTLNVVSTSLDDDVLGTGARKLHVFGLDGNFQEIDEEFDLDGTTPVTGTKQFLRVNRAFVSAAGTYSYGASIGGNVGVITITNTTAGRTQAKINIDNLARLGQTEIARYTVPRGATAFGYNLQVTAEGSKPVDVMFFIRTNADITSGDMTSRRMVFEKKGITSASQNDFELPFVFPECTDIWVMARQLSGSTGSVEVSFTLMIVEDE